MNTNNEPDHPTMFHYLLELHRNGISLGKIELNVPVDSFPVVKMNAIISLEHMLQSYGQKMGWVASKESTE